jgi:hypothetical protein
MIRGHGQKKSELNLYDKFGTKCGGHIALINTITDEKVLCACYLTIGKVMTNHSQGYCTLNALSVVDFYAEGAQLNWCKFMIIEMLHACVDMKERGRHFIFGYILVVFTMWM